jgi:hypothetical protein
MSTANVDGAKSREDELRFPYDQGDSSPCGRESRGKEQHLARENHEEGCSVGQEAVQICFQSQPSSVHVLAYGLFAHFCSVKERLIALIAHTSKILLDGWGWGNISHSWTTRISSTISSVSS